MLSSLPDYRRFAEADFQWPRKENDRKTSDRFERMFFNVVLLAALWGGPMYARWMILSDMNITDNITQVPLEVVLGDLPEAVLGEWRFGAESFLEFTPNHQLELIGSRGIIESADYQIVGDVLKISGFKRQPDNLDLAIVEQCYRISIRGGTLIITPSDSGFTPFDRHTPSEGYLRSVVLPPFYGAIIQYQRAEDR
jgi:hypothetical protein